MIQSVVFALLFSVALWFAYRGFRRVSRNIHLGRPTPPPGNRSARWRNTLLIALGQKKMFRQWTPAVFHFFIYVAFIITQVELAEIVVDGFSGSHRFFAPLLGHFYTVVISGIELFSVLAFVATVVFLVRRNLLPIARFRKPELNGFPRRDANIILLAEIVLIVGIIAMNGADKVLQNVGVAHYPPTGDFLITSRVGPLLFGQFAASTLIVIERFGWWLHLATVLGFMVYLPYSKHLHIILAFPATWYARLEPNGAMHNMPEVQKEVRILMGLDAADSGGTSVPEFGANDVTGLPRPLVLQAYACTECGRCTAVCPANLTGKKLSPRKIMMDVRDRADAIGRHIDAGNPLVNGACTDGKTLFDTITPEEIHACTTCNACVEACPVLLNPLDILHQLRRYEILTLSAGPAAWLPMFNAIENNGSAWAMASSRDAWTQS